MDTSNFLKAFRAEFPNVPLQYHHHVTQPKPPLATYEIGENDDVIADDVKIIKRSQTTLTLFQTTRDFELENSIEDWLDENNSETLSTITSDYIEEVDMYSTTFEFNLER